MDRQLYKIKKNKVAKFLTLFLFLTITHPANADKSYSIYLDADFTGTKVASMSIQQGINVA
ncbi:MAG TPA: hypothetical protein DIS98_00665, partial [Colwellia sp.]|nr:hypothetical protein [Colwellia sp.]